MIDVTAPAGTFAPDATRALARELAEALLRAEGAPLAEPFVSNTGVFLHRLPADDVHTAATSASATVRVEVLTPPGALDRAGQRAFVADATAIVARHAADPTQGERTWVLLSEAADGGWGVAGTALGAAEFAALRGAGRRAEPVATDA
jgi:phenylpyruvate tautomerase PptA (4-oxalocrotonate tautomerase family)